MPGDELVISTKAGYYMWPGPYGDLGSPNTSSPASTSAKRLGLDYGDIFYHHRFGPGHALEESLGPLDRAVKPG